MESDTFWLSVLLKRVWPFQELMFQFGKVAKMETLAKINYDILLFPISIKECDIKSFKKFLYFSKSIVAI